MVKIDVRGIAFDCDQSVYFPGQVISGEICLQSPGNVKLRRILVRIYGRAETRVEEVIKNKMRSCKRDHRDHCNILDYNVTVWEKGDRELCSASLAAGKHTFSFSYQLPMNNLPNSYHGDSDHNIRYMVIISIDQGWKFEDIASKTFHVVEDISINRMTYERPVPLVSEKQLPYLFCCSGTARLAASLEFLACYIGESINIQMIELENNTRQEITGVAIRLIQTKAYKAKGVEKVSSDICLVRQLQRTLLPGQTITWTNETLVVTKLQPSIAKFDMISVSYILEIQAFLNKNTTLSVEFPIIIGDRPDINPLPSHKNSISFLDSSIYELTLPGAVSRDQAPADLERCTISSNLSSLTESYISSKDQLVK